MSIFQSLFGSQQQALRAAQQASLRNISRDARLTANAATSRGAINPVAASAAANRAAESQRARVASAFSQQEMAAKAADQAREERLIGAAFNAAGSGLGMLMGGVGGNTVTQGVTGQLLQGAGGGGPISQQSLGGVTQGQPAFAQQVQPQMTVATPVDLPAPSAPQQPAAPAPVPTQQPGVMQERPPPPVPPGLGQFSPPRAAATQLQQPQMSLEEQQRLRALQVPRLQMEDFIFNFAGQ